MTTDFSSDNVTGVAPEIMAAIARANAGTAASYGTDAASRRLEDKVAGIFETAVAVFPVTTGTAANALALAALTPPHGAIYCHAAAHIATDECGAPEFFSGGAKLVGLPGEHGKLRADTLARALAEAGGGVHRVQPAALSLTQSTDWGTVYRADEIRALSEVALKRGLKVHMDGARFANAVAGLGCRPADITWRVGVDVLSLGATKNGALAAEAVVFFDPALAGDVAFRRKRSGHLLSKMRFVSAQLEAYLADGLWLRNAAHANRMAARMAEGLARLPDCRPLYPVDANEIFLSLRPEVIARLTAKGFGLDRWDGEGGRTVRLVTAFNTDPADVDALVLALGQAVKQASVAAG